MAWSSDVGAGRPQATLESGTAGDETPLPAVRSTPNVTPVSSVSNQNWIPADVPIPKNVNARGFVGSPRSFSYLTDLSFTAALGYYQRSMEEYGWTQVDYGTRIGKDGAELQYRKGSRKLTVRIAAVNYVGTIVEIEEWV